MRPRVIAILGPTATGKSALALRVAERLHGEIVNADALQVYRGLDIGTAKPPPEERRRVPHHLIDVFDPDRVVSAGALARMARAAVGEIAGRGRLPILVGGSGLYVRSVLAGISPMPPVDPRLREWLDRCARRQGLPPMRHWLRLLDPETARRTTEKDPRRTLRALEIVLASGHPQPFWVARQPFGEDSLEAVRVGLTLPRAILYDRIAGRVSAMVAAGWVGEVENLLQAGLDPGSPAFQAIGYRQLAQHVRGEIGLDQAVEETIRATRRFAKRQMTWFRKEPDVAWFPAEDPERTLACVLEHLRIRGMWRDHGEACD